MRLLEYEGKALLRSHGLPTPRGGLLTELPPTLPSNLVVKAQTFAGGRAKRGGIRFASGRDEAAAAGRAIGLHLSDGETVHDFLVEERLSPHQELYAAAMVDRDRPGIRLLAGRGGGIEVEDAPPGSIRELAVDPSSGRAPELGRLVRALGLGERAGTGLARFLAGLLEVLVEEDAELVEVNPLCLLEDGSLVAADARIVLDDDAAARHPDRRFRSTGLEGTEFEREAGRLGVIGVEMEGDIVFFSNGAGLTMATLDQLAAGGGRVAAMVELHGVIAQGAERLAAVAELLLGLRPRVLLVNIFYQFRSSRTVAEGLAALLDRVGPGRTFEVVARISGVDADASLELLATKGARIAVGFEQACALALDLAGSRA